jgi:aspartyl protease family protein
MKIRFLILSVLLCFSHPGVAQELEIDVVGLFKNAAMLKIDGKEQLLKTGSRSLEGVMLVSADSKGAVIEVNGESMNLDLSSHISASFKRPVETSVSILRNGSGQYITRGTINGQSVRFLVDTGANVVALNSSIAASLGLDVSQGKLVNVSTASGVTESRLITLDVLQIGNIKVSNVQAAVITGNYPVDILLGMTFLENVDISESAGVMQLKGKF